MLSSLTWCMPDEHAYVSVPYVDHYQVHVRCPNCGADHMMPTEGPIPKDEVGLVDWDRLQPFIDGFAQIVMRWCESVPCGSRVVT